MKFGFTLRPNYTPQDPSREQGTTFICGTPPGLYDRISVEQFIAVERFRHTDSWYTDTTNAVLLHLCYSVYKRRCR